MSKFADIRSKTKPLNDRSDILGAYYNDIRGYRRLSLGETRSLFADIRGDDADAAKKATDTVVCSTQRLVVSIARCYTMFAELGDLISEGNVGVMRAVELYDPDNGCEFSTYAALWIRRHILRYVCESSQQIRRTNGIRYGTYGGKAYSSFYCENGREPTEDELSDFIKDRYGETVNSTDLTPIAYTRVGDAGGEYMYGGDTSNVTEWINVEHNKKKVGNLLRTLNERERDVLLSYYGIGSEEPESFRTIADRYSVSEERIKQIHNNAIKKLRKNGKKGN